MSVRAIIAPAGLSSRIRSSILRKSTVESGIVVCPYTLDILLGVMALGVDRPLDRVRFTASR